MFAIGNKDTRARAIRSSPIGKRMPSALYIHRVALPRLPVELRVYEGCAQAFIGAVDDANVIKLGLEKAKVSYLAYPRFDRDAHPCLSHAITVDLSRRRVYESHYEVSANPPVLHRKEALVPSDYPSRSRFADLTKREEELGLYADVERIGRQKEWGARLAERGIVIHGHRLIRVLRARRRV